MMFVCPKCGNEYQKRPLKCSKCGEPGYNLIYVQRKEERKTSLGDWTSD